MSSFKQIFDTKNRLWNQYQDLNIWKFKRDTRAPQHQSITIGLTPKIDTFVFGKLESKFRVGIGWEFGGAFVVVEKSSFDSKGSKAHSNILK